MKNASPWHFRSALFAALGLTLAICCNDVAWADIAPSEDESVQTVAPTVGPQDGSSDLQADVDGAPADRDESPESPDAKVPDVVLSEPKDYEKPYASVYSYEYYLLHNPDIQKAYGSDRRAAFDHFIRYGMSEGRDSSPSFDVVSYYNAHQDLRAAYGTSLKRYYEHYVKYGEGEGRVCSGVAEMAGSVTERGGVDYSPVYDASHYRASNPDLDAHYTKRVGALSLFDDSGLLDHFIRYGMSEGRDSSPSFDVVSYYNAHQDLRAAYGTSLKRYYEHYVKYGEGEGRVCSGVAEMAGSVTERGGVDYSPVYDASHYRASNPDLDAHYTKRVGALSLFDDSGLLDHFIRYGMKERRSSSTTFDVRSYYNEYEDLRRAYGVNWPSYYTHFARYGEREGRAGTGCASLRGWQYHNVIWCGQPNNYYCGPSSGTMILQTAGAHRSSSGAPLNVWNLAKYMRTDSYGYTSFHDRMFQTGMNNWLGRNAYTTVHAPSYSRARDLILQSFDRGMAAALDAQERRGGPHFNGHNNATFSHIMVVDGYNNVNDHVILADPGARVLWGGAREKFEYPSLNTFITTYCQREIMGDGRQHIGIYAPV